MREGEALLFMRQKTRNFASMAVGSEDHDAFNPSGMRRLLEDSHLIDGLSEDLLLSWLTPVELGRMELSCRKMMVSVSSYAAVTAEKKYSDATAAKVVGIQLGTRYLWGRELGVTFPPERPEAPPPERPWLRRPERPKGTLPPSLQAYLGDWFFGEPTSPDHLARARPEADFYFLLRVIKDEKDVVQQLVPLSALGNATKKQYHPGNVTTPFDLQGDRLPYDYDSMEKEVDVWDDTRPYYEDPSEDEHQNYNEKFLPWAKSKWEAHRAAFRAANDVVTFRVVVHVVRRDTRQFACVIDHVLVIEPEETGDDSYKPTFGYDTVALRTPNNINILGCCGAYIFQPQFALGFNVHEEAVLGNGDLVRTTFRAMKFRLSFRVRTGDFAYLLCNTVNIAGSQAIFSRDGHGHNSKGHDHDRTLLLLRNFNELWRPVLPSS